MLGICKESGSKLNQDHQCGLLISFSIVIRPVRSMPIALPYLGMMSCKLSLPRSIRIDPEPTPFLRVLPSKNGTALQRYIPMLLGWVFVALNLD